MELKLHWRWIYKRSFRLLIEPYWNWNMTKNILIISACLAFNRTILELKQDFHIKTADWYILLLIEPYWNWNCKCRCGNLPLAAFNRTILELKQTNIVNVPVEMNLLIEPYWNWNIFKIYYYENWKILLIEPYWNWNADKGKKKTRGWLF